MSSITRIRHLPSPVQIYLARLHARLIDRRDGHVADYIPELAKADPTGSASASRPSTATSTRSATRAAVHDPIDLEAVGVRPGARGPRAGTRAEKVGVEPSGDAFNSISLEPDSGRPLNPMINAGAIADVGTGRGRDERGAAGAHARCDLGVRRPPAVDRRRGLRVRTRHRPPQPGDRSHAAQLRHRSTTTRSRRSTSTSSSARSWSTAATWR